MNAVLHERQIDCYQKIYTEEKMIELTGETVVPDKLPDIGLPGDVSTNIFLRAKRVEQDAVTLDGDLCAFIGYIPDGAAGVRGLEVILPWQVPFTSDLITGECAAVCELNVLQSEARLLNPRKVLVKVRLQVVLHCYVKEQITVFDGVDSDERIQVLKRRETCSFAATVCEKSFVVTDEYPLSHESAGGNVLHRSVQFRVDDVKTLSNKLIVKGTALTNAVIGQESGFAEKISVSTPFSFIAETDCESVPAEIKPAIVPTAIYMDITANGQTLSLEVHGVCQMVAYKKEEVEYIADAYSNFHSLQLQHKPICCFGILKFTQQRETVNDTVACRGQVGKVHFVTAAAQVNGGKESTVQVIVSAAVYLQYENGTVDCVKKTMVVPLQLDEKSSVLGVRVTDIHTMTAGSEVDLRISLEADICSEQLHELQTVCGIEVCENGEVPQSRVSLTLVREKGGLWNIARKYKSTVGLICLYNEIEDEDLAEETLLMIPRQRM